MLGLEVVLRRALLLVRYAVALDQVEDVVLRVTAALDALKLDARGREDGEGAVVAVDPLIGGGSVGHRRLHRSVSGDGCKVFRSFYRVNRFPVV